jgi:hypothetical protein
MQGYVSGSPRFSIEQNGPVRVVFQPAPLLRGPPARVLRAWVNYTRHMFSVQGFALDYYGKNPRHYYVVIDGRGNRPAQGERIYAKQGIEIFKPAGQTESGARHTERGTETDPGGN